MSQRGSSRGVGADADVRPRQLPHTHTVCDRRRSWIRQLQLYLFILSEKQKEGLQSAFHAGFCFQVEKKDVGVGACVTSDLQQDSEGTQGLLHEDLLICFERRKSEGGASTSWSDTEQPADTEDAARSKSCSHLQHLPDK